MPVKKTVNPTNAPMATTGRSAIRTVAPLLPLAVALVHQGLTGGTHPAGPHQPAPTVSGIMVPLSACGGPASPACNAPYPMLAQGHPVNWWFVFKLNVSKFPGCAGSATVQCAFGGDPQSYKPGLQYAYASSDAAKLEPGGNDCLGDGSNDPVGATFDEVYHNNFHYVLWNDQFYGDPAGASCGGEGCDSPWGHSKGMIAWNDAGEGMVMQVSTPSWPAAGSANHPRKDGNTLGCVKDDNVKVSQHFFAMRLSHEDLLTVLDGLNNASVVTKPNDPQIVSNGGPADVQGKVNSLGVKSSSTSVVSGVLSTGVELISKPSNLHVPPWQIVSSVLGGVPLRTATWWANPPIPSAKAGVPGCWDNSLTTPPGDVEIATSGTWKGTVFSLKGGISPDANHAKLGVSTADGEPYVIFGDMNQQGSLSGDCGRSQNGRGGMFFVMSNPQLQTSMTGLLAGTSAPQ